MTKICQVINKKNTENTNTDEQLSHDQLEAILIPKYTEAIQTGASAVMNLQGYKNSSLFFLLFYPLLFLLSKIIIY